MAAVALALASALAYGLSDFLGGFLSKSRSVWAVAVGSQATAALATLVIALLAPGDPTGRDFAWGAAAGLAGALGISALYRGLSAGRMNVVAPLSGTGAAFVPIAVGLASGEQPTTLMWVGIALAVPAMYFIPRADEAGGDTPAAANGTVYGILAGLGFGGLFASLGQIGHEAGFLPLSLMQLVNATAMALVAVALRQSWVPRGRGMLPVYAFGLLGTAAVTFFLLATREGLLTVVSLIAALYPAGTVAMAALVLRERLARAQALGLALAGAAVVLVTIA